MRGDRCTVPITIRNVGAVRFAERVFGVPRRAQAITRNSFAALLVIALPIGPQKPEMTRSSYD